MPPLRVGLAQRTERRRNPNLTMDIRAAAGGGDPVRKAEGFPSIEVMKGDTLRNPQVNDFLPEDVASPTDLRAALERFEDMDIKVLEEVPTESAEGEIEAEPEKEPDEEAADAAGDSSDPVRLYLKEMGNFQLLSREQEVEIAKRIEAGEQEVEEEVLKSPVTLDFVIGLGERAEEGEIEVLRDIFED